MRDPFLLIKCLAILAIVPAVAAAGYIASVAPLPFAVVAVVFAVWTMANMRAGQSSEATTPVNTGGIPRKKCNGRRCG